MDARFTYHLAMVILMVFIACVIATTFWKNYKRTIQWIFLPFLIYVFCNEVLATVVVYKYSKSVEYLYNSYLFLSFSVYSYWFYKLLKESKWIFISYLVLTAIFIIEFLNKNFLTTLFNRFYVMQSIFILLCSLGYFRQLLQKEEVIKYYILQPFWIVAGLLIFHLGLIPLIVFQKKLILTINYQIVLGALNVILYSCYTISFLVTKNNQNYSP